MTLQELINRLRRDGYDVKDDGELNADWTVDVDLKGNLVLVNPPGVTICGSYEVLKKELLLNHITPNP